jgi:hypothetical protein
MMDLVQILSNIEIAAREVLLQAHPKDDRSWLAAKFQLYQLYVYKNSREWRDMSTCDFFKKLWDSSGSKIQAGHKDWTLGETSEVPLMNYVARIYEVLVLEQLADEIRTHGCEEPNLNRLKLFQRLVKSESVHESDASSLSPLAHIRLQQQRQILSDRLNSLGKNPSAYKSGLLLEFYKEFRAQNFSPIAGGGITDVNSVQSVQREISTRSSVFSRCRQWPRSILSWPSSRWRTIEMEDGTDTGSRTSTAALEGDESSFVATTV